MSQVMMSAEQRSHLQATNGEAELLDEDGQLLGYFVPPQLHRELILTWSRAHVSDEELDRARREPGGRSLHEILADLKQR